MATEVLIDVQSKAREEWTRRGLMDAPVSVTARTLSTEEALGNPEADDFPLQQGKERLMEADFLGAKGQAFTDRFGDFSGTLGDVATMSLENNFRRAVFVSTLNAVSRHLNLCDRTIHCKDQSPAQCAGELVQYVEKRFGNPAITLVGYQPMMVEKLGEAFPLRVLDLDPDNIGQRRRGILIEGPETAEDAIAGADILLVTGSTLANDTLGNFLRDKPVIFFGTTIAGAASLMGWERFCAKAE